MMHKFDLSDVDAQLWVERQARTLLNQRSRAFALGFLDAATTPRARVRRLARKYKEKLREQP